MPEDNMPKKLKRAKANENRAENQIPKTPFRNARSEPEGINLSLEYLVCACVCFALLRPSQISRVYELRTRCLD